MAVLSVYWVISLQVTPACSEDTNAPESILSSQPCSTQLTPSNQDHHHHSPATALELCLLETSFPDVLRKC